MQQRTALERCMHFQKINAAQNQIYPHETKALKIRYNLITNHLIYTGSEKLLVGTEFETLTLNQQMAPQYLLLLGEVGYFKQMNE
jgi:glycogen synthase